jgi:hypothetical protein
MRKRVRAAVKDTSAVGMIMRALLVRMPGRSKYSLMEQVALSGPFGGLPRPHYSYSAVRASELAVRLGYEEVTWIEFGVATGNGLIALEAIKAEVERQLPIRVRIVGFDMGSGLPAPVDYRDLPYHWKGGFYEMDVAALQSRLTSSRLVLGPVAETLSAFIADPPVDAPVGMISFDLDYYSSTVAAFDVFRLPDEAILPRVMCYMDDIAAGAEWFSDYTGVRLAIREFNERSDTKKLSPCYDFVEFGFERWQEKVMIYHDFAHTRYNTYVGDEQQDAVIPLRD